MRVSLELVSGLGPDFGIKFDHLATGLQKVIGEGDRVGLKQEQGRGAAEGEISLFIAFGDLLAGSEGLVDRSHTGCADFHANHSAEIFGHEFGDGSLVFPEVGEFLAKCEWGD